MVASILPFAGAPLLALCTLLAPLPAGVASPSETPQEQAASKALLASQKELLKQFRTQLAATSKSCVAQLGLIEQALLAGDDPDAQAELLFDELVELQVASTTLVTAAAHAQAAAAVEQLGALGPLTEGLYPRAFYPGDGTSTAGFELALEKELAKVYGKLIKRLTKTVGRFEQAGVLMTLRLVAPERPARVWNTAFIDYFVTPTVTIDVALAWSVAATTGAGRLRVAGRAQTFPGYEQEVTLTAFAIALAKLSMTVTPANERYRAAVASDLVEGVYLLGATQDALAPAALSIGLR